MRLVFTLLFCLWAQLPGRAGDFVKGADVSWLPQMEASNFKFYDASGAPKDCLQILKDNGVNSVRLRVFVNPSEDKRSGHCSKDEVVKMAVRAQNMGFRILIDFHYSDSWADPGKQNKPAAWAGHDFPQLLDDVYNHTYDVLNALKSAGVTPEWVQVGNEIPQGLLWPDGSASNWPQLTRLLNKGYDAVKAVDGSIKVMIHLNNGSHNDMYRKFFDNFQQNGGRWDVIGMSYYPDYDHSGYTATIDNLAANLNDMASRYDKEVMVAEVGGKCDNPQESYNMLMAVQDKVKAVPGNRGLGVFYWEPEGAESWSGYKLSCWGKDGKPTMALTAFKNAPGE